MNWDDFKIGMGMGLDLVIGWVLALGEWIDWPWPPLRNLRIACYFWLAYACGTRTRTQRNPLFLVLPSLF